MNIVDPAAVILANGAFPTGEVPLGLLRRAAHLVCCDGAADKALAHGLEPEVVVGDLDSISDAARAQLGKRVRHVGEQETNDLSKAYRYCRARGWRNLAIVGAVGGRTDHALANLSLVVDFSRAEKKPSDLSVTLYTDDGLFTAADRSTVFASFRGQQVSIFSFEPGVKVYGEGLKYPLDQVDFTRWWNAALNESLADSFKLVFSGGPLLVFRTYEAKRERMG